MQTIVTADQMAKMDQSSINAYHIPGIVLMENAGRGVFSLVLDSLIPGYDPVWIYCGVGNNGGDGFVVARHLINAGYQVRVLVLGDRDKIKGDALTNLVIIEKMGQAIDFIKDLPQTDVHPPQLIVDAMLGTGVKGALRGLYEKAAEQINDFEVPVIAVDIPTGVNADTGQVEGTAVHATATATMALKKRGLLFSPGREYAGDIEIIDIGMPQELVSKMSGHVFEPGLDEIRLLLPQRQSDAHKNRVGTVAVIAGSQGLTGAAMLSSMSALRTGAGLVYLCVPSSLNAVFESKLTEVITWPFDDADSGYLHIDHLEPILNHVRQQTAIALGPGLGQHARTGELVYQLLDQLDLPMVLDADGLNLSAQNIDPMLNYRGEMIITPHPGEMGRLLDKSPKEVLDMRFELPDLAQKWNKVIILKGGPTLVALPGGELYINPTGNAGLATGGSGDVLTGILAGLLAQGLSASDAAVAGVFLHGLAADIAVKEKGMYALIASDVMEALPAAFYEVIE